MHDIGCILAVFSIIKLMTLILLSQVVLLRISKSCKRADSDGFLRKIRGSGLGFGFWMKVL